MLNNDLHKATVQVWGTSSVGPKHASIKLSFPADQKGRQMIDAYCKPAQIPYRAINVVGQHANSKYFEVYFSPNIFNNTLQLNLLKNDQSKLSDPDHIIDLPIAMVDPRQDHPIHFGLDVENMLKAMHDLAITEAISAKYTNNHLATILNILRKGEPSISKDALSYNSTETPPLINTQEFTDLVNKKLPKDIYQSALKIQSSFIKRSDIRSVFKQLDNSSIKTFVNKLRQIKLFFQEKTNNFLTLLQQKARNIVPTTFMPKLFNTQQQDHIPTNHAQHHNSDRQFSSLLTQAIKTPQIPSSTLPKQEDVSKVTVYAYSKDKHNQYDAAGVTLCFPVNDNSSKLQNKYLRHLPHVITKKTFISSATNKPETRKYYEVYFRVEQVNTNTFLCSSKDKNVKKPDMIMDFPLVNLDLERILHNITALKPRSSGFFQYTKGNAISMMVDVLNTKIISPTQTIAAKLWYKKNNK